MKNIYWIIGIVIIFFVFSLWYYIVYVLDGGHACPPDWETKFMTWMTCVENLNTTLGRTPNSTDILTYCGNRPYLCD
jgi:hypothetical protein